MAPETEPIKETKTVTAEGKKLRDYELAVVITPEATEEKFESRLTSVSQFVVSRGGAVESLDRWGKKRLAYPIKKSLEGNYVLFHIKLPPEVSRELEASLRISEDVLRYLLVKTGE